MGLTRRRITTLLVFAWIALVAAVYYKRIWQLFSLGPKDWILDNPSLAAPYQSLQVLVGSGFAGSNIHNVQEAWTRALISIAGAALVFIAAQTLGAGICKLTRCEFDNWMERFIFNAGIGFGVLSYISLGMAALGIYRPAFVQLFVLATAAIGIIRCILRFREMRLTAPIRLQRSLKWNVSVWQVIALVAALIALIGALAPEIEYDALWYHLWLPRLWLEQGSPVDLVSEYISLYPLTWELVYGAGLVMGGPIAAKLLSFSCLPLTAMVIYQLVHRYVPQASPWLAVTIWITTPTVLWEATTTYVDLALGFYVMLVVYSVIRYAETRERPWIIIAGFSVGFALGIKHLALIILLLVSIGLALKLWLSTRTLKAVVLPLTILVGIGLLIALPWYARNWQASRNPVFPEFYSVFGAEPPQRWDAVTEHGLDQFKAHFGRPRTFSTLVTLPWDMTIHAALYGGNLGPLFLMFLPALLLFRNRTPVIPWLGWLALLYILFWASSLSSFQMRFLLPIVPVLAILTAASLEQILRVVKAVGVKWGQRLVELVIVIFALLNLPPFTSLHEVDRLVWDGWLTHVVHTVPLGVVSGKVTEADYLNQKVASYAAWQYIDTNLASESRILTFSGGDHFYSHRQRLSSDSTMAHDAVWVPQRGEEHLMLEQMKALGITHILFDKRQIADLEAWNLAIIQPEVISGWYVREYEDSMFILYRLVQE
jgi:hypothetical protein